MKAKRDTLLIGEIDRMLSWSAGQHREGRQLALVPTMGALHEGHLSLVRLAAEKADRVVVSIFVNPVQFGPREDFDRYPRDLERDLAACRSLGVDAVFAPSAADMYLPGHGVFVDEECWSKVMCGATREGHFRGVLTVVAKLFNIVRPDTAVFGRKDAQQAALVGKMIRDLNFPVTLVIAPTVRDRDGLALSSRNAYLKPEDRRRAGVVFKSLTEAAGQAGQPGISAGDICRVAREGLSREPGLQVEYLACVDAHTLQPVDAPAPGAMLAVAAWIGGVRLVDNIVLG